MKKVWFFFKTKMYSCFLHFYHNPQFERIQLEAKIRYKKIFNFYRQFKNPDRDTSAEKSNCRVTDFDPFNNPTVFIFSCTFQIR